MFCLVFSGPICSHFFKVARPKSASNEVYSSNRREASTAWWERSLPCVTDFEGFPLGNAIFNFRRKSLLYFTTFPRHRSPTFSAGFCQCAKNTSPILRRSGRSCSSSSSTRSDRGAAAFYATSTTTSCHFFRAAHPVVCLVDVPVLNFARYLTVDSSRARTARIFALTDSGLR